MTSLGFLVSFFNLFFPVLLFASWAEDRLQEMTLEQKIGQLLVVPACPKRGEDHKADWRKLLQHFHVGHVMIKQSDPLTQVQFLNGLQKESALGLWVLADAEWGLAMRMTGTLSFPKHMTLGAVQNIHLIEKLGFEIGRQAKLVGVHMNLAPVADVNSNPNNPVIGMRSFGVDPAEVVLRVVAFTRGLESSGIRACVKHFPGHGDTDRDSHRDLPVISHSMDRFQRVEWIPFQKAIESGASAVMSAHLYVPTIDDVYPSSLSPKCLNVLRQELGFQGLIVSDALNMKALTHYSPERVAVLARQAGSDLLLYGAHMDIAVDEIIHEIVPRAYLALKNAYTSGELSLEALDATVLKILKGKEGLQRELDVRELACLHSQEAIDLKKELYQQAVTLIGEEEFSLPQDSTYLSFGEGEDLLSKEFGTGKSIVIGVHGKLTEADLCSIELFKDRAILCLFVSPYELQHFQGFKTILLAYENDPCAQQAVLNILMGHKKAVGKIPI